MPFQDENQSENSLFQPLTILEIEAVHKTKGTLENFKEIALLSRLHTDIYKSTIVMFVSEVLHHSIHEEEQSRF
jgi:DNA repair protein RecO (recombination protein O)